MTMLLSVLKQMSTWPFGLIIFSIVIGPWLLAFIYWRMDTKRYDKLETKRQKELQKKEEDRDKEIRQKEEIREKQLRETLDRYKEDVSDIKRLYESNSRLVVATNEAFKRLEIIYNDSISIISLNTQAQTKLVSSIETNQFCPVVRDKRGPIL